MIHKLVSGRRNYRNKRHKPYIGELGEDMLEVRDRCWTAADRPPGSPV
jgi:hypothetical protein